MLPNNIQARESLPVFRQIVDLFLMELADWARHGWQSLLFTGVLASLNTLVATGIFGRDNGVEALNYILTGSVVGSLLFGTMSFVQGRFIYMRVFGTLEFYSTLPIWRYGLILATVLTSIIVSIPSLLTVLLVGSWVLQVPLKVNVLAWVILPLATLPFAAIGALVGTTMRTINQSSAVNRVLMLGLTTFGPVLAPPELLPNVLVVLGRFNPAFYAASALRQVLLGPITIQLVLDIMALVGFTAVSFWIVSRRIDWQQD